jgi:hypothetical protein
MKSQIPIVLAFSQRHHLFSNHPIKAIRKKTVAPFPILSDAITKNLSAKFFLELTWQECYIKHKKSTHSKVDASS